MKTGLGKSLLVMLLLVWFNEVNAFSSKLSPPWEAGKQPSHSRNYEARRVQKKKSYAGSKARVAASSGLSTKLSSTQDDNQNDPSKDDQDGDSVPLDEESLSPSRLFLQSSASELPSSTKIDMNQVVNGAAYEHAPTVLDKLGPLFQLTRPANFPGIVFLHLLGGFLALAHNGQRHLFKRTLFQTPSMWVVLAALLLTSSTSMVVNDYYDKKLGRDTDKLDSPLVSGELTLDLVRNFLNYLYAMALLCVAVVPGVPARISVVIGLMLTFWYTKHLKPRTWVKNTMCATLIALSPFTTGSAALKAAAEIEPGLFPWGELRVLAVPSLWRLVAMLFCGVCGREIMMDITDLEDDKLNNVRTIPVKYGRRYASCVAMICYLVTGLWVLGGPVLQALAQMGESTSIVALKAVLMANIGGVTRKLLFGGLGALMLARRGIHVFRTAGEKSEIVEKTVNEAQLAMIVCLVSFI